jgi:THO complex subunit 2
LIQFLEFLTMNLEPKVFDLLIPSVEELCSVYGLEPSVAFLIARPKLTFKIKEANDAHKLANPNSSAVSRGWNENLSQIAASIQPILPAEIWKGISPQFFVTFWQLSLYDIFVPTERYKEQVAKQEKMMQEVSDQRDAATTELKRRKEKERFQAVIEKLKAELQEQTRSHEFTMKRLMFEKEHWFEQASSVVAATTNLFQYCIFPRCLMSAADASFSAKFVLLMHKTGTANFSSLGFYDRVWFLCALCL